MDSFEDDFINLRQAVFMMNAASTRHIDLLSRIAERYRKADTAVQIEIIAAMHRNNLTGEIENLAKMAARQEANK